MHTHGKRVIITESLTTILKKQSTTMNKTSYWHLPEILTKVMHFGRKLSIGLSLVSTKEEDREADRTKTLGLGQYSDFSLTLVET